MKKEFEKWKKTEEELRKQSTDIKLKGSWDLALSVVEMMDEFPDRRLKPPHVSSLSVKQNLEVK